METIRKIIHFIEGLLTGGVNLVSWFTSPIVEFNYWIGEISFTPIELLGITGLIAFIEVAVIKWLAT